MFRQKTARKRGKVERLWSDQLGLCRWCGRETYLHDHPKRFRPITGALSGKAATLDHLYTKFNPLRTAKINGVRYVMACSTCNTDIDLDKDRAALADFLRVLIVAPPSAEPVKQRPPALRFRVIMANTPKDPIE